MLTRIVHPSPALVTFCEMLGLPLTEPQKRHLINLADGILVTEGKKTLANIQRQFVEAPDPSNIADFLRISPWPTEDVRRRLQRFMVQRALEIAGAKGDPRVILVAVDDSIAEKDKQTSHLEAVDWHYDHLEGKKGNPLYKKGMAFIVVHVLVGSVHLVFDISIYLREKTIRRLNRRRPKEKRLRFGSKYRLVRRALEALKPLLPPGWAVYILCDRWYTSRRLINYCRRQGWHLAGAIKANRKLDGVRVDQKERSSSAPAVRASDRYRCGRQPTHLFGARVAGKLYRVSQPVRVWVSRRHPRDQRPVYLMGTDLALEGKQAFQWYGARWWDEVDNYYLKELLGLGDFRVQPYEAAERWVLAVLLAWNYVLWRKGEAELATWREHRAIAAQEAPRVRGPSPADIIRQHREEHAVIWLASACRMAIQLGEVKPVLQHFLRLSVLPAGVPP